MMRIDDGSGGSGCGDDSNGGTGLPVVVSVLTELYLVVMTALFLVMVCWH